ncbi:2,4-dihydroxyhept-2-ene-1,7-dioic acid aldolase [Mycena venus]|uniref:2,4-dihydroxyhept-2-ene-1,7-dioic acid aldolase n=1 Tax=Mycena venus TaxID=2733690 RepID=A0A8H6Z6Z5_9AGAR|nr:2,4-dihydroxyhept-2-ene-1,7-dioic acid aldolase [Mycena venus]
MSSQFTQDANDQKKWIAPTHTTRGPAGRHVAKSLAMTGADWCWLDAEHIAWTQKLLVECIQVIIHESGGKMIPIYVIGSWMELGCWCCWDHCPSHGIRGRDEEDRPDTDHTHLSHLYPASTATRPKSAVGIKHLAEIVASEEVSAFMIGPGDLRLDLGLPQNLDGDEPMFIAAMETASKVAKERGIPIAGFAVGPEMTKRRIDQGFRLLLGTMALYAIVFGVMSDIGTGKAVADAYLQSKANGTV